MASIPRPLISSILACSIVTLVLSQRYAGIFIVFFAFFMVPWLLYMATTAILRPTERKQRLTRIGIWMLGITITVSSHVYMHFSAQHYATEVSGAIDNYMERHGTCPPSLEIIGISSSDFKRRLGYASYSCKAGIPNLFYGTTYVPFALEDYDFSTHQWRHIND